MWHFHHFMQFYNKPLFNWSKKDKDKTETAKNTEK